MCQHAFAARPRLVMALMGAGVLWLAAACVAASPVVIVFVVVNGLCCWCCLCYVTRTRRSLPVVPVVPIVPVVPMLPGADAPPAARPCLLVVLVFVFPCLLLGLFIAALCTVTSCCCGAGA